MNSENAIEVRNMSKSFKISRDRANSLKDLLLIRGRSKPERHEVLNDITLDIKKGEPLVCLHEVIYDQKGRPLHNSIQLIRGDRFVFRI